MGRDWLASAWKAPSQIFLRRYKLKDNQIASARLTHLDRLQGVAAARQPTCISRG